MAKIKIKSEIEYTPREIVRELDKYIIGQDKAKRSVAIALRNRWRRKRLPEYLKDEVAPKNIIMIGPTGVGKTEIARRLAKLVGAPFIKVEATKYTEIGYVGRDVESMIRDLVNIAINEEKSKMIKNVEAKAIDLANNRIAEILLSSLKPKPPAQNTNTPQTPPQTISKEDEKKKQIAKEMMKKQINAGKYDNDYIEVRIKGQNIQLFDAMPGMSPEDSNAFQSMIGNIMPNSKKEKSTDCDSA